jgi:hypothetical protein
MAVMAAAVDWLDAYRLPIFLLLICMPRMPPWSAATVKQQ